MEGTKRGNALIYKDNYSGSKCHISKDNYGGYKTVVLYR